jgi:large subunit ribosomal protein L17
MRFMMTAKAVALGQRDGLPMNSITQKNIDKVTRYRENGKDVFEDMVEKFKDLNARGAEEKSPKGESS